jgi:hypothetical protein
MSKYIDIVLTANGVFCVAPPWVVKVGDLVCLPNGLTGKDEMLEVVSVSTDGVDGEHIKQIEKYIGYPLPRITAKYLKSEVEWDAVDNDR